MCVCAVHTHRGAHRDTQRDGQAFIEPELLNRSRWLRPKDLQGESITVFNKSTKSNVSAGGDSRIVPARESVVSL